MRGAFELAWAVNHGMEKHLRDQKHLTLSRLMILRLLAKTGSRNVSDVAAFLGVSDADASAIIDKLVSRKLLQRVENRSDRRIRDLTLTPSARQLLSGYEKARKRLLAQAFRACSSEDLRRASEVLDRVAWCVASHRSSSNGGERAVDSQLHPARPGSRRGGL